MADYGAFFVGDDGSLLVTSDSACYECYQSVGASSRTGNVNVYYSSAPSYPLVFIACGKGYSAGIMAIEGAPGSWTITAISTSNSLAYIFVPMTGNATSGYGTAVYDASGNLTFDSNRNLLNARNVESLASGQVFTASADTNMVSYTAGGIYAPTTVTDRWERWPERDFTLYVYPYGMPTPYDRHFFWVRVRRTTWSINRGAAKINANSVSHEWVLHQNGYYDVVIGQGVAVRRYTYGYWGEAYMPAVPSGPDNTEPFNGGWTGTVSGPYGPNNTFPYTNVVNNDLLMTCITGVTTDYV